MSKVFFSRDCSSRSSMAAKLLKHLQRWIIPCWKYCFGLRVFFLIWEFENRIHRSHCFSMASLIGSLNGDAVWFAWGWGIPFWVELRAARIPWNCSDQCGQYGYRGFISHMCWWSWDRSEIYWWISNLNFRRAKCGVLPARPSITDFASERNRSNKFAEGISTNFHTNFQRLWKKTLNGNVTRFPAKHAESYSNVL